MKTSKLSEFSLRLAINCQKIIAPRAKKKKKKVNSPSQISDPQVHFWAQRGVTYLDSTCNAKQGEITLKLGHLSRACFGPLQGSDIWTKVSFKTQAAYLGEDLYIFAGHLRNALGQKGKTGSQIDFE